MASFPESALQPYRWARDLHCTLGRELLIHVWADDHGTLGHTDWVATRHDDRNRLRTKGVRAEAHRSGHISGRRGRRR
jgi:hypothetical protein